MRTLGRDGGLGIPTWLYGHEPTTPFARVIAKYFQNSIREKAASTRSRPTASSTCRAARERLQRKEVFPGRRAGDLLQDVPDRAGQDR